MNHGYRIIKGLHRPRGRPIKRKNVDALIILAADMNLGDAAVLTQSEAQTFRVILAAQGFKCITDGYRCDVQGYTLAFKLEMDATT